MREQQGFTTTKKAPPGAIDLYHQGSRRPAKQDEDEGYDDELYPRLPSSSRRYVMPDIRGDTVYHKRPLQTSVPSRRSATQTAPTTTRAAVKPGRRIHWLAIAGLSGMFMLVLVVGGVWVHNKWLETMDDWTYTSTFRTFSIDQAVGHNGDSASRPSHFIVQNDHTEIVIVEFPADDPGRVIVYYGPSLLGDGQERVPVTISFQPDPQTGRIDMVLHVEGQGYVFVNNGSKFVSPRKDVVAHNH